MSGSGQRSPDEEPPFFPIQEMIVAVISMMAVGIVVAAALGTFYFLVVNELSFSNANLSRHFVRSLKMAGRVGGMRFAPAACLYLLAYTVACRMLPGLASRAGGGVSALGGAMLVLWFAARTAGWHGFEFDEELVMALPGAMAGMLAGHLALVPALAPPDSRDRRRR